MNTLPDWKAWSFHALLDRLVLLNNSAKRFAALAAVALMATLVVTNSGYAQSNVTGSISGKTAAGSEVTAVSVDTGYTRTATASSSGSFVITALPPGRYRVSTTGEANEQIVDVNLASTTTVTLGDSSVVELEKFVVASTSVNPIDFGRTESVTLFTAKQINELPVARNTTAVSLLAPGTVAADPSFGKNLASFGGASIAENAYFVNGFNLSDFRVGVNPLTVPFEAYEQYTIMTGGYSAEFGRSLGGIVNATTKTGSNEYHAGVNVYHTPDALYEDRPSREYTTTGGARDVWVYNGADKRDLTEANLYASGPIIKDRAFFYILYNYNSDKQEDVTDSGSILRKTVEDNPFYLVKLDANIFPGHNLELTYIKNEIVIDGVQTDYDYANKRDLGTGYVTDNSTVGGEVQILRYTGSITDSLTLSGLYGKSESTLAELSSNDLEPLVLDARAGAVVQLAGTSSATGQVSQGFDTREAMRFDLTYTFSLMGDHQLRVGFDRENNSSQDNVQYSGGVYWRYVSSAPGYAGQAARARVYQSIGSFDVLSDAYYIEDNWSLMDNRLRLRLGLRNESFENLNKAGDPFIKIDRQLAPRLGASYDLFGDQKTKLSVNYGRYHIPVASNTNVRLSGGELFTQEYYVLNSVNADGTPNIGAQIGGTTFLSDGTIPDKDTIVDKNIKPMFQDEYIIGIQQQVSKDVNVGARFTYRDLKSTMDDMIVDHALTQYAQDELGLAGADFSGYFHYVLGNPGSSMQTAWDFEDGNGVVPVTLTAEQLGYSEAVRKYVSMELYFERVWDGKWYSQFSYTWAHNYGNTEGQVLSDNAQTDAGITIQFDTPQLGVGSYGNLPNDRRHAFKFTGAYALTDEWQIGAVMRMTSGRPLNKFGWYNDPVVGTAYGSDYFITSRGSAGRTDWEFINDVQIRYKPQWAKDRLTLQVDINNLLNQQPVIDRVETSQRDIAGNPEVTYLLPTAWQTPRRVTFAARYEF